MIVLIDNLHCTSVSAHVFYPEKRTFSVRRYFFKCAKVVFFCEKKGFSVKKQWFFLRKAHDYAVFV